MREGYESISENARGLSDPTQSETPAHHYGEKLTWREDLSGQMIGKSRSPSMPH